MKVQTHSNHILFKRNRFEMMNFIFHGSIIALLVTGSMFFLACGSNKDAVTHKSESVPDAFAEKPAYAASQTATGSKKEIAGALPKGLWEAILAKYRVKADQVEVISLADLNGDGKGDAIVKIRGDYSGSCGCTAAVFRKDSGGYRIVSDIGCVDEIAIDEKRTNGWLDLMASSREGYFRLAFNGRSYPITPLAGKREKKHTP